MLSTFLITFEQMLRIFLFLATGFLLNRLHILPKSSGIGISKLVTSVLLPALWLHTNITEFELSNIGSYGKIVFLGCVIWAVITLLAIPFTNWLGKGDPLKRGIYLYGLSFPNTSAVAIPLTQAFMGNAGVFLLGLFILPFNIMTYVWGIELFLDMDRKNPLSAFWFKCLTSLFSACWQV